MPVTNLFLKHSHGGALQSVGSLDYGPGGIRGNVACAPFRQVLIASQSVTAACGLQPGDLRENIVVDFDALYELRSGTVVQIGPALVRLTFHCEPCKKILSLVPFDRIVHKRGVLGSFLNAGTSTGLAFVMSVSLRIPPDARGNPLRGERPHPLVPEDSRSICRGDRPRL